MQRQSHRLTISDTRPLFHVQWELWKFLNKKKSTNLRRYRFDYRFLCKDTFVLFFRISFFALRKLFFIVPGGQDFWINSNYCFDNWYYVSLYSRNIDDNPLVNEILLFMVIQWEIGNTNRVAVVQPAVVAVCYYVHLIGSLIVFDFPWNYVCIKK